LPHDKNLKIKAPRAALMGLLDKYSIRRAVYIHAPAGFGKTATSLLWLEHRKNLESTKQAIISLDAYDDKPSEFCRRFVLTLSSLQPENAALSGLTIHPAFAASPFDFALNAISLFAEANASYALVFDDLHVIKNEEILGFLPILIKRIPNDFTILLLSRTVPPDSFSEMVVKGEMALIDAEQLQFDQAEIRQLFEKNGKRVSHKQAGEIMDSTGGWAIGICALLLSQEKSYKTQLTDRYLENFLKTHVWERWDAPLKNFMLKVCVVEEFMPDLCDHLIAGDKQLKKVKSADMLMKLLNENAFLRLVGEDTYKFHDLFRDFLMRMLEQLEETPKQYDKAGQYFYNKKDYFRSVQYYLKAENDDGVADSLFHMYNYNSPYASIADTLSTASSSTNQRVVDKHPFLLEVKAWCAFVDGRADEFESYVDKYYEQIPKIIAKRPRSAIVHVFVRCMDYRNNFMDVVKSLRRTPFMGVARAYAPSLTQSLPYFHRGGRDFSELSHDMKKNLTIMEKTMGVAIGDEISVITQSIYAGFYYEKGKLCQAHQHALAACAAVNGNTSPEIKFSAMMILASVLFADGQMKNAAQAVLDIESSIEQNGAFYLIPNLRAYKFNQLFWEGNKAAASQWLDDYARCPHGHIPFYKIYLHFTSARAHIAVADNNSAILLLKKLLTLAESYRRPLDITEALILIAIANWKKGGSGLNIALDHLERAITIAYEYKYTQLFANEGAELVTMLHRLQKRTHQSTYQGNLPADFVKTLYIAAVSTAKHLKGLTGGTAKNIKFTDKQKEVMRLMCAGYSRNEIAAQLGLKPNGVKSHTTLIYKKLDVPNSVEAVLKIRELGLLD